MKRNLRSHRGSGKSSPTKSTSSKASNSGGSGNSEKISKYFIKEKCLTNDEKQDFDSPYKQHISDQKAVLNDTASENSDFKTPKLFKRQCKAQKVNENKKATTRKRKQNVKKTVKSNAEQITLPQLIDSQFSYCDTNPEHMQMAIALSRSENPTQDTEEFPNAIFTSTRENILNVRATLEQFGFKSSKPTGELAIEYTKRSKKSKFRFITPVLFLRKKEDREMETIKRISRILAQSIPSHQLEKKEYDLHSGFLEDLLNKNINYFQRNNLPSNMCKESFYVPSLNLVQSTLKCGTLLKDWNTIPGRDKSPRRKAEKEIEHITRNLDCDKNNFKQSSNTNETSSESREMSPDLFPSDDELENENSTQSTEGRLQKSMELIDEIRTNISQLEDTQQCNVTNNLEPLEITLPTENIAREMTTSPPKIPALSASMISNFRSLNHGSCSESDCETFESDKGIKHFESFNANFDLMNASQVLKNLEFSISNEINENSIKNNQLYENNSINIVDEIYSTLTKTSDTLYNIKKSDKSVQFIEISDSDSETDLITANKDNKSNDMCDKSRTSHNSIPTIQENLNVDNYRFNMASTSSLNVSLSEDSPQLSNKQKNSPKIIDKTIRKEITNDSFCNLNTSEIEQTPKLKEDQKSITKSNDNVFKKRMVKSRLLQNRTTSFRSVDEMILNTSRLNGTTNLAASQCDKLSKISDQRHNIAKSNSFTFGEEKLLKKGTRTNSTVITENIQLNVDSESSEKLADSCEERKNNISKANATEIDEKCYMTEGTNEILANLHVTDYIRQVLCKTNDDCTGQCNVEDDVINLTQDSDDELNKCYVKEIGDISNLNDSEKLDNILDDCTGQHNGEDDIINLTQDSDDELNLSLSVNKCYVKEIGDISNLNDSEKLDNILDDCTGQHNVEDDVINLTQDSDDELNRSVNKCYKEIEDISNLDDSEKLDNVLDEGNPVWQRERSSISLSDSPWSDIDRKTSEDESETNDCNVLEYEQYFKMPTNSKNKFINSLVTHKRYEVLSDSDELDEVDCQNGSNKEHSHCQLNVPFIEDLMCKPVISNEEEHVKLLESSHKPKKFRKSLSSDQYKSVRKPTPTKRIRKSLTFHSPGESTKRQLFSFKQRDEVEKFTSLDSLIVRQDSTDSVYISDEEVNYSSVFSTPHTKKMINLQNTPASPECVQVLDKNKEGNVTPTMVNKRVAELKRNNGNLPDAVENTPTTAGNVIVKTRNVTPMPDYDRMNTPTITKELEKVGVRNLKRHRGVHILKHIYEMTHPVMDPELSENSDDNRDTKRMKSDDNRVCNENDEGVKIYQSQISQKCPKSRNSEMVDIVGYIPESDNLIFERTQSKKVASCALPLHIAWFNFLVSNPNLKESVLLYEPLQLEVLYTMLKDQGFKYHIQDLLTFLDKKCITIRTNQQHCSHKGYKMKNK